MVVVSSLMDHLGDVIITSATHRRQTRFSARERYYRSMESLDSLLREAETAHGHLCAGQVLGVRMAMLGCRLLGIEDPRGLVTRARSEEHTSELQSLRHLVCRLLLEKK